MRKLFEGLPDSFLMGTIPFIYLFFYLFYVSLRGSALNIFEMYSLSLIPLLIILGVRGRKFFDITGWDLNHAPLLIRIGRFAILTFTGFLIGYGLYKLSTLSFALFGFHLFPFDVFYLGLSVQNPTFLVLIDSLIIAVFEETIRIIPALIYSNAFYRMGYSEETSIVFGVLLSSIIFIVCHVFSWGGLSLMQLLLGTSTIALMTLGGWVLRIKEIWGSLAFKEFSIYTSLVSHLIFDFLVFAQLAVIHPFMFIFGLV